MKKIARLLLFDKEKTLSVFPELKPFMSKNDEKAIKKQIEKIIPCGKRNIDALRSILSHKTLEYICGGKVVNRTKKQIANMESCIHGMQKLCKPCGGKRVIECSNSKIKQKTVSPGFCIKCKYFTAK